jgi:hypothetical protein
MYPQMLSNIAKILGKLLSSWSPIPLLALRLDDVSAGTLGLGTRLNLPYWAHRCLVGNIGVWARQSGPRLPILSIHVDAMSMPCLVLFHVPGCYQLLAKQISTPDVSPEPSRSTANNTPQFHLPLRTVVAHLSDLSTYSHSSPEPTQSIPNSGRRSPCTRGPGPWPRDHCLESMQACLPSGLSQVLV